MAQQIFVHDGSETTGPFTPNQIRDMAASGELARETLVCVDGEKWFPAEKLRGLTFPESAAEYEVDAAAIAKDAAMKAAKGTAIAVSGAISWISTKVDERKQAAELRAQQVAPLIAVQANYRSFMNDSQNPGVIEKVVPRLQELLMSGEQLLYVAVQQKPVVNIAPDCVALTNKRFLFISFKIMGRMNFEDRVWRNLSDARIEEGLMGSTFSIRASDGLQFVIDYLPKAQARFLYRFAQEQEEAALEERRNRKMEEDRAKAGGVTVQSVLNVPQQSATPAAGSDDPMKKLSQLKQMMDAGLISSNEYEAKKADILAKM